MTGRRYRTPRPARWMDLHYAGHCHVCDADVPAGGRGFYDPATRKITCTNLACASADGLTTWRSTWPTGAVEVLAPQRLGAGYASPAPARIVVTRFASGATSYRNSRGRCEDAPCCGCCD